MAITKVVDTDVTEDYLFVKYRTKDEDIRCGKIKGQVISISLPHQNETIRGNKEGDWLGFTKIPMDRELLDLLLTGQKTIDVSKSSTSLASISPVQDLVKIEASHIVSLNKVDWRKSPYFQKPASKDVYSKYIKTFLNEFTRLTKHIPIEKQIELFPHAWIFPSSTKVSVGRDGVAFSFDYPSRPDESEVNIDINKIVENLLLPHCPNNDYLSNGALMQFNTSCDDTRFLKLVGNGNFGLVSELGNPNFVILEKSFHAFLCNIDISRGNLDGNGAKQHFKFVELFGNITKENYTRDKAKHRAQQYVQSYLASEISNGKLKTTSELRTKIEEFKALISTPNIGELKLEEFLDKSPWILERGLGYKKYHSQVAIDKEILSRSEAGIKPDKFLERHDGYCDILDLKRSDVHTQVKKSNRTHASSKLTEAEAQVDNYIEYVNEPKVRDYLRTKGIKVLSPRGLVLMGRAPQTNIEDWELVKKRLSIKAITYDDLINELQAIVGWIEALENKITETV